MEKIIQAENLKHIFREKKNNGAEFTVQSLRTGKDYTFKVSRSKFKDYWYTHVYVEQGYDNFVRLGTFTATGKISNKQTEVKTPAAEAIAWLLRQVVNKDYAKIRQNVKVMHTGSCLVCGRKLTDAVSIQTGIGPVCRN